MKRPVFAIGSTYLLALVVAINTSVDIVLVLAVTALLIGAITLFIKKIRDKKVVPIICFSAAVALFAYSICFIFSVYPVQVLNNQETLIVAKLKNKPYQVENRIYYPMETSYIGVEESPQKINITLSADVNFDMDYYDEVECIVTFSQFKNESYAKYNLSKGNYISSYMSGDDYTITKSNSKPFGYYVLKLRDSLENAIKDLLPPNQAALSNALLLGNKNDLSQETKDSFRSAGVSHIIVVSGLHLSVLTAFVFAIIKKVSKSKKLAAILSIAMVIFFMAITGFSSSVIRAGIMMIILMLGNIFSLKSDSVTSLAVAAIVLGLQNPLCGADTGLLMSFTSTLGIVIIYPKINKFILKGLDDKQFYFKPIKYIVSIINVSISAVLMSFPVTFLTYGTFNLYFLLSNLLVTPLITVVLVSLLFAVIFYYIPFIDVISNLFAMIAGLICNYFTFITELISKMPFATININTPPVYIWFFVTVFVLAAMLIIQKGKPKRLFLFVTFSFSVLLISSTVYGMLTYNKTTLNILDCGGGNTSTLSRQDEYIILSCGGKRGKDNDVIYKLSQISTKPELLVLPDKQQENIAYAISLITQFDCENILLYDTKYSENLLLEVSACNNITRFSDDFSLSLWDNSLVEFYSKDDFVYTYAAIDGITVLFMPSGGNANDLPKARLSADVVVLSGVPGGIELITCENYVLTSSEETVDEQVRKLPESNAKIYATVNGDVQISTSFNGEVEIWQN